MLGITVPDAIAVGTLIAAALAGWFGRKSGDALARVRPQEPATSGIAAGFVDKDLMVRLTMACESIAATLKVLVGIQTDEHERAVEDRLERIEAALTKKDEDDARSMRSSARDDLRAGPRKRD